MANGYIENIEKWKTLTDIDYFTYFIKAWISFNAWYRNHYQNVNSDREAINKIKNESNTIRSKSIGLLNDNNTSEESTTFKTALSSLHKSLLELSIENEGKRLSFEGMVIDIDRTNLQLNHTFSKMTYFIEVTESRGSVTKVICTVKNKANVTIMNYSHTEYSDSHLRSHNQFNQLSDVQKQEVINIFEQANPFKLERLLTTDPNNNIKIGNFTFVKNEEKIFKCLIEILYGLRNSLFHGEIVPNKDHKKVYEHAYKMLKILLDTLE